MIMLHCKKILQNQWGKNSETKYQNPFSKWRIKKNGRIKIA